MDGKHLGIRRREFEQIESWFVTEKIDGTNIRVCLEAQPILEQVSYYDDFGVSQGTKQTGTTWCVRFHGRTERAQIPPRLLAYLEETFTAEKMRRLWKGQRSCEICGGSGRIHTDDNAFVGWSQCACVTPYSITLYGEGYGGRVQKGGRYRPDESFRLFDVVVESGTQYHWLEWANVRDIAAKLGIKTVPVMGGHIYTSNVEVLVQYGLVSYTAREDQGNPALMTFAEGIVARTDPYLYDGKGRPVRFKLKTRDYGQPKKEAQNV